MSDYAENLDPDLARKYRFSRRASRGAAIAAFLTGLIVAIISGDYYPAIPGTTIALVALTFGLNGMTAAVNKQRERREIKWN